MTSMAQSTSVDRELAAVLITLAPLGGRGSTYLDTRSREFHADKMLNYGWSTGERWLILCAKALWRGTPEKIDLAYIATLDESFLLAVVNGIAAYRGRDFSTDWAAALAEVSS
jgi:hypothetical protein